MLKSFLLCPLAFHKGFGQTHAPLVIAIFRLLMERLPKKTAPQEFNIGSNVESSQWEDVGMEDMEEVDSSDQAERAPVVKRNPRSQSRKMRAMSSTESRGQTTTSSMPTPEQMSMMLEMMKQQGLLPEQAEDTVDKKNKDKPQKTKAKSSKAEEKASGRLPDPVYRVQQRRDLQHHEQPQEPRDRIQVEDPIADAPGEERGGGPASSPKTPLEEKSKVGDAHARPALGGSMGALGSSQTAMLESENVLAGHHGDGGGKGVQQEGVLTPSDPNAPTIREQQRRYGDRLDLVNEELMTEDGLHAGQVPRGEEHRGDDSGVCHLQGEAPGETKKITLNRRQRRNIMQGVQKALRTHQKIYEVVAEDPRKWKILEEAFLKAPFPCFCNFIT